MSELNNVVDDRMTAAEVAIATVATAATNAQTTANAATAAASQANLNFTVATTAPASPVLGQLWSDTSNPGVVSVKCFNGSDWIQINPA